MDIYIGLAVGIAVTWIGLMVVIPVASRFADFSVPPWPDLMLKLVVISAAVNVTQVFLGEFISPYLGLLATAGVFFTMLYKWFGIDLWVAVVVAIVSWFVRFAAIVGLVMLLHSLGVVPS